MIKQSSPKTATEWVKRKFYGNNWGIHSPEIIKSPFDSIMDSYIRLALMHRQIALGKGNYPEVYFNEYGEITKISKPVNKFGQIIKTWGGKSFEDWYKDLGFFFEDERP